jgi:hypothetical protein
MSYSETLKISDDGRYRVRLVADECADEPYDDGQSPLLRFDYRGSGWRAEHIMATGRPADDDDRIEEAAQRWGSPSGDDFALFEKYLRAYYGTTEIETWYSGSFWYVTYDTSSWRAYTGFEPGAETPHPLVNMNEYKAWCEGDCWGYAVEQNVTWQRADDPDESMQTWKTVDDCWGFYGSDYARERALAAFEYEVKASAAVIPDLQPGRAYRARQLARMA